MSGPHFDRRALLRFGGMAVCATAATGCSQHNATPAPDSQEIAFHGEHQAGVLQGPAPAVIVCGANVTAGNTAELTDLFRTITQRARFLTAGGIPPEVGITAPPADSGSLGPTIPSDGLTVTVGVGASLFDERFGLAGLKPRRLSTMTAFSNDDLQPQWCHGDISIQLRANNLDTSLHALRDIARHTRGGMQISWSREGFTSIPRPEGTPRNHFGFRDGTSNPDVAAPVQMDQLVWAGQDDLPWTRGGSYQVIRLIRMLVEFWDRISITEQEQIFGRNRISGAPLDGNFEADLPNYDKDPSGDTTPLTAHIRLANPRTPQTDSSRILRRAYNYSSGMQLNGNVDVGLIFTCFQQDIDRQFVAVQTRLDDEPLVDYVKPYGGGYFFVLPGVRDGADYLARSLVERNSPRER